MKSLHEPITGSNDVLIHDSWIDVKLCTLALPAPKNNSEYKLLIDRVKAETLAQVNTVNKDF